jgi:hypothetical protein
MAKVFCIFEENHGFIGVATTPNATAHWLIDSDWINKNSDYYDEKSRNFIPLEEMVSDSYMGEWENWFIDQVEENGTEFLFNLGFQMVEEELAGEVEDLLPR